MRAIVCGVLGVVAALPASAQILPQDPVFANSFDSGAVSLSPTALYIAQGASGDTLPVALTLTLSEPAVSDNFVPVVSADPSRLGVVGGGTTVLTGQNTATVQVSGLVGGALPVTVTATLGNAVSVGVRVEAALNEVGSAGGEADFCNLQFPGSFNTAGGQVSPSIFGQLFQSGITDPPGPPPGWIAALGYGPIGSDPRLLTGWHFVDAGYNVQVGNNDEFMASLVAPWAAADYAYTFRFSQDAGASWTYCDTDGAGANAGLTFDTGMLGTMTVQRSLVINEVDYDNVGSIDTMEFVEIYNTAATAVNLSGLALVLVNGNDGNEYRRVDLGPAGTLPPGGYLVVHDGSMSLPAGTLELTFAPCADGCIQNGAPDGVALINTAGAVLVDALSYEGSLTAAHIGGFVAPVNLVEGTATTAIDGNVIEGSMVRLPNGADTDNANDDWASSTTRTPGAANLP
jgi:hypothetical protein